MFEGFDGWLRISDNTSSPSERPYTVSEFVDHCNFILEREFSDILVEGEVASFKISQGKWVFFDLKEGDVSINCFMVLTQLTSAISDGMKVRVRATPKVTRWGRFSLTVSNIQPIGEGDIRKSFELLKKKLATEGLFDPARKRPLPENITKIGVISSTGAAGYADFLKILDNRWGGLEIKTINTQVQGLIAPEQIIRALQYFNERSDVDVIAILRGGGSADDLAAFNDEALARAIAASKIPVLTGIGHEIDESLADLAADVRASTPSNAAERLTPDRRAMIFQLHTEVQKARYRLLEQIANSKRESLEKISEIKTEILRRLSETSNHVAETRKILLSFNPEDVLRRGYAIVAGKLSPGGDYQLGDVVRITTFTQTLTAEVKNAQIRKTKDN